jgi:hypothetical protein
MSVASGDIGFAFVGDQAFLYCSVFGVVVIGLYLFTMKTCFGTYSLKTANQNYTRETAIKKRYAELFQTRENMLYHISWSKSEGELEDAKRMMRQLTEVDQVSYNSFILACLFHLFKLVFLTSVYR